MFDQIMPRISEKIESMIENNEQLIQLRNTQINALRHLETSLKNANKPEPVLKMASKPVKSNVV